MGEHGGRLAVVPFPHVSALSRPCLISGLYVPQVCFHWGRGVVVGSAAGGGGGGKGFTPRAAAVGYSFRRDPWARSAL